MNEYLTGINDVAGVVGSAVFDAANQCVAHAAPSPYEPILLSQVMEELRSSIDYLNYIDDGSPWETLIVNFEGGIVYLRKVDDMSILVLAQPTLNSAMLGVALNVVSLKLQRGQASGPGAASRSGTGMASGTGAPRSSTGMISQSGMGSSPSLSMSGSGQVAGPNAVGHEMMNLLLKCLAKQIGPIAKIALKEELGKMGVTAHTIERGQFNDLVLTLLARIPDPDKRKEFLDEMRKVSKK